MNFWDKVKKDNEIITRETGIKIKLIHPQNGLVITISAVSRDISLVFDPRNIVAVTVRQINAKINICDLEKNNYPYKNDSDKISLMGHKVEIVYPGGETKIYEIVDFRPDRFFSNITLVLDVVGQRGASSNILFKNQNGIIPNQNQTQTGA
ncbi:MAG: hypothetical protein FWF51_13045 [Chitinivibrionia bacterium]|nr:hypothetical protein [Chitinivibrionia bacterium]